MSAQLPIALYLVVLSMSVSRHHLYDDIGSQQLRANSTAHSWTWASYMDNNLCCEAEPLFTCRVEKKKYFIVDVAARSLIGRPTLGTWRENRPLSTRELFYKTHCHEVKGTVGR